MANGIESDIICLALRWARLDVPAALALGVGARAAATAAAAYLIQRGIQLARIEGITNFNLFTPIPPVSVARIENALRLRALGAAV
jgi:hypothetical protein